MINSSGVNSGKWGIMHSMFKTSFPALAELEVRWGRYDQASIFIELRGHNEYIYSYKNERDWCLQTKTNYLNFLQSQKARVPK